MHSGCLPLAPFALFYSAVYAESRLPVRRARAFFHFHLVKVELLKGERGARRRVSVPQRDASSACARNLVLNMSSLSPGLRAAVALLGRQHGEWSVVGGQWPVANCRGGQLPLTTHHRPMGHALGLWPLLAILFCIRCSLMTGGRLCLGERTLSAGSRQ